MLQPQQQHEVSILISVLPDLRCSEFVFSLGLSNNTEQIQKMFE